jgi:O-antigen/teichoic acid export membrane protein
MILVPGTIAMTSAKITTKYLSGSGAPGKSSLIVTIGAIVGALASFALIPTFEIKGAAWASTIGYTSMAAVSVIFYAKAVAPLPPAMFRCSVADVRWILAQLRGVVRTRVAAAPVKEDGSS